MKIKYRTHQGQFITQDIKIGQKLVGIRVIEFIIESWEESKALMLEKNIEWFKHNINFEISSRLSIPNLEKKSNCKDSNWGSDWVDDGV